MLLTRDELVEFVDNGYLQNVEIENINGASIDVRLGDEIAIESNDEDSVYYNEWTGQYNYPMVDLSKKENIKTEIIKIPERGYKLQPNQFILANTIEKFFMPSDIAGEFYLKSSSARNGLEHLHAGWADPWWNDATLTLELKNLTQYHTLILRKGMKIGQMVFWRGKHVEKEHGYAVKGQYNNSQSVTPSKGIR